jgi:TPR repeat protein
MTKLWWSSKFRLLTAAILFVCPSLANAFDQRLAGSWHTVIATAAGSFRATWTIGSDGKYEVQTTGPATEMRDVGTFAADGGRWSKQSTTGSDGGSYVFEASDRLTVSGGEGTLTWFRLPPAAAASAKLQSGAATSLTPAATSVTARNAATADSQAAYDQGSRLYQAGDKQRSFPHFLQAAQQGHVKGQLQVGWHYEFGVGVARNDAEAATWYEKSALAGNAIAMKNIGQMYEDGRGVRQDWFKAAAWYRKSAAAGERSGEFALARAYRFGIGVHQSRAEAIRWYTIAAEHGEAEAADDARWLSDSTNNVGFRTKAEHNVVINNKLRTSAALFGADPAGICFRDANERTNWLVGLRSTVDKEEEESRREIARRDQEHEDAVKNLINQGYSRSEAEAKAPR